MGVMASRTTAVWVLVVGLGATNVAEAHYLKSVKEAIRSEGRHWQSCGPPQRFRDIGRRLAVWSVQKGQGKAKRVTTEIATLRTHFDKRLAQGKVPTAAHEQRPSKGRLFGDRNRMERFLEGVALVDEHRKRLAAVEKLEKVPLVEGPRTVLYYCWDAVPGRDSWSRGLFGGDKLREVERPAPAATLGVWQRVFTDAIRRHLMKLKRTPEWQTAIPSAYGRLLGELPQRHVDTVWRELLDALETSPISGDCLRQARVGIRRSQ